MMAIASQASHAPHDQRFVKVLEANAVPPGIGSCFLVLESELPHDVMGTEFRMKVRATASNVTSPARMELIFGFRNGYFFMENI
jgi:hypothetical protein